MLTKEPEVVGGPSDVLAADDHVGAVLSLVALPSVERLRLVVHLDVAVADIGERGAQRLGVGELGGEGGEVGQQILPISSRYLDVSVSWVGRFGQLDVVRVVPAYQGSGELSEGAGGIALRMTAQPLDLVKGDLGDGLAG